jgi:putative drug exporter of the RND superfamily
MFERLGAFIYANKYLTLVAAIVNLVLASALLVRGGHLGAARIAGLEADRAVVLADGVTGRREETTFAVVFRSDTIPPSDARFRAAMTAALAPLRGDPGVESITSPDEASTFLIERLRNEKAHAALALVTLRGSAQEALDAYPSIRRKISPASAPGPSDITIVCTGQIPYLHDLADVLQHDLIRAEVLSLPLALLVLLLVFRTAVAAALPVVVGGLAVICGVAIVLSLSRVMPIAQYTVNVCSLIGFGVAIDYSLFLVSRYREELAAGLSERDALIRSMGTAGRSVAFSGVAVFAGLAGLFFFEGSYLSVMGLGGSIVVGLAVIFALTLLPALLAILGPRIHRGRLPGVKATREPGRFWSLTARWVMRRPLVVLVPTLGLLLFLAAPAARMRLAAADATVLPTTAEARQAMDVLDTAFPTLGSARIAIVAKFPSAPVLTDARASALWELSHRIAKIPGIARVESIVDRPPAEEGDEPPSKEDLLETLVHPSEIAAPLVEEAKKLTVKDDVTVLFAVLDPSTVRSAAASERVVKAIRSEREVADGEILVGGKAARDVDATHFLVSRAPRAAAFVVGITFVVILVLLRSIVLPIKAVLMNALSISATFGALVWVFQDGHLLVAQGRPLEPTLPVLLFCVSFGLSMDYEVLMLARMKEGWERTGDNETAVEEGLENTAGLITSAAAIMIAVFGAFALARIVLLQATGTALALAVALDATLVRALLVPATMRLFGRANWWAPRWPRSSGKPRAD